MCSSHWPVSVTASISSNRFTTTQFCFCLYSLPEKQITCSTSVTSISILPKATLLSWVLLINSDEGELKGFKNGAGGEFTTGQALYGPDLATHWLLTVLSLTEFLPAWLLLLFDSSRTLCVLQFEVPGELPLIGFLWTPPKRSQLISFTLTFSVKFNLVLY